MQPNNIQIESDTSSIYNKMNKTILYSGFILALILVILIFLTAKSYYQLAVGIILYPALTYFALKVFPRKILNEPVSVTPPLPASQPVDDSETIADTESAGETKDTQDVEVVDLDKRTFLKLVGSIGISFFIFSLLGQRIGNLLFGNQLSNATNQQGATSPGGSIESAFSVAEIDEGELTYYGFTDPKGGWLIMKQDSVTNSFRYAKGDRDFPTNWSNRFNLKYDYYYNTIK